VYILLLIYVPAGRNIIPYPSPCRLKPVGQSGFGYNTQTRRRPCAAVPCSPAYLRPPAAPVPCSAAAGGPPPLPPAPLLARRHLPRIPCSRAAPSPGSPARAPPLPPAPRLGARRGALPSSPAAAGPRGAGDWGELPEGRRPRGGGTPVRM
jgi:hypothetical protein